MSNQSGFDYDVLISRLYGGVRAFQSLRAHRRQREQPPPPDERPSPPPRPSQPHADEPPEARAVSPLEPQAFIAVNGRVVPLFGDLGSGMVAPASPGPMPPPSSDTPPTQARPAPAPTPEEAKPAPAATAPVPAASPLKLPPPTPPARLGLIYGNHARAPAAEPPPAASAAAGAPTAPSTAPNHAPSVKPQEMPSIEAITALLDARAAEETLRLEKVHAEHRACVMQLLQEHRNELRAQTEADATRTSQLLRDLFADHRAQLAQAARTHADHLAQLLDQHHQHTHPQSEPATPSDDALRSALLEQAKLQRDANEATAEHIGALTTIVADLGQAVGMLAVAAVQGSSPVVPSTHSAAKSPPSDPPTVSARTRASPDTPQPESGPTPLAPVSDRPRTLQSVDHDGHDDDLTIARDDNPPPHSRVPPSYDSHRPRSPTMPDNMDISIFVPPSDPNRFVSPLRAAAPGIPIRSNDAHARQQFLNAAEAARES